MRQFLRVSLLAIVLLPLLFAFAANVPPPAKGAIPPGSKLFVADSQGFEKELREELADVTAVEIVDAAENADFIVKGTVHLEAHKRRAFGIMTDPFLDATMTIRPAKGGDDVYFDKIHIRFVDEGTRDGAVALARRFGKYMVPAKAPAP